MNKIIYFRGRTDAPLKVVKDDPRSGTSYGCATCFFKHNPGGCPTSFEEKLAGAGFGCLEEQHHYEEHECAS